MTIISTTQLSTELPAGAAAAAITNAVNQSTGLVNAWAEHYEQFPDHDDTQTPPYEIQRITLEIAKATYYQGIGQLYRDGQEQDSWQAVLNRYEKTLREIDLPPTGYSKTIALDSNGVMLIQRGMHVLRYHPGLCHVTSAGSSIWNQGYHWDIRKGEYSDEEYYDGWYFDAAGYSSTIEGTLYYARSWRNDGVDYLKFAPDAESMNLNVNPALMWDGG